MTLPRPHCRREGLYRPRMALLPGVQPAPAPPGRHPDLPAPEQETEDPDLPHTPDPDLPHSDDPDLPHSRDPDLPGAPDPDLPGREPPMTRWPGIGGHFRRMMPNGQ